MSNNSNLWPYNPKSWGSALQHTMEFSTMIMLILEPSKMRTQLLCWVSGVTRRIIKCLSVLVALLILWPVNVLVSLLDLAFFFFTLNNQWHNLVDYEYKTCHMQKADKKIHEKNSQ